MEPKKPIKRDKVLQPLSHDHHQGLLLCWKIRTGIKKGIELWNGSKPIQIGFIKHI